VLARVQEAPIPRKSRSLTCGHLKVVHSAVSGRIRLHSEDLYRSENLGRWIEAKLSRERWIERARVNIYTGSILIRYNPKQINKQRMTKRIRHMLQEAYRANIHRTAIGIGNSELLSGTTLLSGEAPAHPWHLLDGSEAIKRFESSEEAGLTHSQIQNYLKRYGYNIIPTTAAPTAFEIFTKQFQNFPTAVLGASVLVSALTGGMADAAMITVVILLNSYIGYVTESSAEETLQSLTEIKQVTVTVIRSGRQKEVPVAEVVPGDLLILSPGLAIPADLRLLKAHQLSIDESLLTGESLPVNKSSQTIHVKLTPLADRTNMAYCGTTVTGGSGLGIIVATGRQTEIGIIQSLMGQAERPPTPLQRRLEDLTRRMVTISFSLSFLLFIIEFFRKSVGLETLKASIALAVAAAPEGLPTVAVTTLAQAVKKLEKQGILARRLEAIETLGTVDVICLDKTGTITLNQMSVAQIMTVGQKFSIDQNTIYYKKSPTKAFRYLELLKLIQVGILCNEAGAGKGSSTESALLELGKTAGFDIDKYRGDHPNLLTIHRSEQHKIMSTVHDLNNGQLFVAVKGSPHEVLNRCEFYHHHGKVKKLTSEIRTAIQDQNSRMASDALRVLGFAYRKIDREYQREQLETKLIWLGLVGMSDPIRPGIKELISQFTTAGIRPIMITGDQSNTAAAVGKLLNLGQGKELTILDSTRLENVEPEVLTAMVSQVHIFSRVSPAHKLQIVQALQRAGKTVAMTGDGINDGPALKVADVGIAMSGNGTDIARRVADIILLENKLTAILSAIEEGRTVHQNIKKAVDYIVGQNFSEILFTFVSVAAGLGEPLSAMQLLWINLVTDIFPELALTQELPESDVLKQKPESSDLPILELRDYGKVGLEASLLASTSLSGYLYGIRKYGPGPQAKTLGFLFLNTASLLYTFSARSRKISMFEWDKFKENKFLPAAIGIGFTAELAAAFVPFLRSYLGGGRVTTRDLGITALGSVIPLLIIELTKYARRSLDLEANPATEPGATIFKEDSWYATE